MLLECDVIIVLGLMLLKSVTWMRMGTGKHKFVTQAAIGMMMIGKNLRRSGYLMMSIKRKRRNSIGKMREGSIKRTSRWKRRSRISKPCLQELQVHPRNDMIKPMMI